MIPPVRTDPVWGRAQSGPVPPEGQTLPGPRLAVLSWTGLVWTSPNRLIFINFTRDPKNWRNETVISATLTQTQPERRSGGKAQWEADKCSKHFGYRLKGKAGNRRPITMTSAKSYATRFYQPKCGNAPIRAYLKQFGHREDDKCWLCGGMVGQIREHLLHHCSRWKYQQRELWKQVGKATAWKTGRWWRHRCPSCISR